MRKVGSAVPRGPVGRGIFQFFNGAVLSGFSLMETLRWFVFREFESSSGDARVWHFASNPCTPDREGIDLRLSDMRSDYTFVCARTNSPIYLTDVFRLHERIDDEVKAHDTPLHGRKNMRLPPPLTASFKQNFPSMRRTPK